MDALTRLANAGVVPVVVLDKVEDAVPTAKSKNGKMIAVYLKGEFGGFAVHLLQK